MKPRPTTRLSIPLASAIAVLALASTHQASALESNWTYTSSTAANLFWTSATSWSTNPNFPNAIDDIANFTANITGARTITLNGDRTVGTLSVDDPPPASGSTYSSYTFNAGTPATSGLIFEVSSGSANLNSVTAANTANSTINVPITLNDPLSINWDKSGSSNQSTIILAAAISDGDSSYSITKSGNGIAAFSVANTYDGGTVINGGRISAANLASFGSGTVAVNSGGQAFLATSGTFTNALSLAGNGYTLASDQGALVGALRYSNNATSNTITLTGDARIGAFNATGTMNGPLVGGFNLEINSSLNALHNGNIFLNGDASGMTGTITVTQGSLTLGASSNLGGNLVVKDGARLSGEATTAGSLVLGNDGSTTTGATLNFDPSTGAALAVGGNLTLNGTTTVVPSAAYSGEPDTVLTYGGNLINNTATLELAGGIATYRPGTAFDLSTLGQVKLTVITRDLVWTGAADNDWDLINKSNWVDGVTPSQFYTLDRVTFNGNVPATASTALLGNNNDLIFTAQISGAAGDAVTIAYINTETPNTPFDLTVSGNAIVVTLGIDVTSTITTTAAEIKAAIEASSAASALVKVANASLNDGSGAVIALTPLSLSRTNVNVSIPTGVTVLTSSVTFDCSAPVNYQLSGPGILGGTASLLKTGAGNLTLSAAAGTYTGGTVVSQGTLISGATGSIAPGTITLGNASSGSSGITLVAAGNTITNNIIVSNAATGLVRIATGSPPGAYGTGTIALQRDVTLAPGSDNVLYSMVIGGTGNVTISGGNRMQIQGAVTTNTWTGNLTIASNGYLQINNSGTGNVNVIPNTANVTVDGLLQLFSGSGSTGEQINGLNGAATGRIEPNSGYAPSTRIATLTIGTNDGNGQFDGIISRGGAAGTMAVTKTGTGTQILTGVNTYTGATIITGGTLEIGGAGQLGSGTYSSAITITSPGTLQFNSTADQLLQTGVISSTGALVKENTGTLTLSAANTFSGNITVSGGKLIGAGATNPVPGVTVFGSRTSTRVFTINSGGTLQFNSGNILGSGHTAVTAPKLVINSGGVVTNGGIATNNALNDVELNGGTLTSTTGHTSSAAPFAPVYGAWNLNGAVTSTGTSTISTADPSKGWIMLKVPGDKTTDFNVTSGTLTVSAPVVDNPTDNNIGALGKSGAGTMVLSGANTYIGNTTVNEGTLELADNAQLKFVLGATSGVNNRLTGTGTGTVTLDGDFVIDTTAANALPSGTWTLESVNTLTGAYGDNFTVVGFDNVGGNQWTKPNGPTQKYTFDETTGILTLATLSNYSTWANDPLKGNIPGEPAGGDFDNDGLTNLMEYALGKNPRVSSQPAGVRSGNTITYPKGADAIANGDVSWVIETSTDLGQADDWTPAVSQPAGDPNPTIFHTFTPSTPVKDFARLRVTQIP